MKLFKAGGISIIALLLIGKTNAQTYLASPVTVTTLSAGSYYNPTGIQLNPTFSFTAGSGQSLQLTAIGPDCQPFANNISFNQNFIRISEPRVSGITTESGLSGLGTCDLMQTVQYFDGLGRPMQTVQIKGSPGGYDIVQPIAYDGFGREVTKYLPYASISDANDGSYKTNALTAGAGQAQFYTTPPAGVSVNSSPYSVTNYEPSPLNRVVEQGAPGSDWQPVAGSNLGHTVKMAYLTNNTTALSDTVNSTLAALYTVTINSDQSRTLTRASGADGNYLAG